MGQPMENLTFSEVDALFRFADGMRMFVDRALTDELHIDSIDVQILMYVAQRGESEQRCIATDIWKRLCIPKSTGLAKINALKKRYITERAYHHELHGQKNLALTEAGGELLKAALREWARATRSAARVLSSEHLVTVGTCIRQAEHALENMVTLFHEEDNADWDHKRSWVLAR